MKQRLSIDKLFLRELEAIMMDEPVLDVDGRPLVKDLIKELASKKVSMVLSSHDFFEYIPPS